MRVAELPKEMQEKLLDELCMGLLYEEFNPRWADRREAQRKRYGIVE